MKTVGTDVKRVDGIGKVTGTTRFTDDLKFPNMLYAKAKRSPYPHARIINIDISKAEQLSGVKAIITGKDVPIKVGLYLEDKTFIAVDKVRFIGEPVAAVAAVSEEIAERAVELIEVEYEPLPAILNPDAALAEGAPLIHEDLGSYNYASSIIIPIPDTNISNHYKIRKGDVEETFSEADYIFEETYSVPHIQHAPIEPHSTIAQYSSDGKVTVWAGCQSPYAVRKTLAHALNLPLHKVRVISPAVGGGFGGKAGTTLEGIVIPLAMICKNRPVKLTYSRSEEFSCAFVRQACYAKIKTAVKENGKIIAEEIEFIWDGGAYTEYGVNIARAGGYSACGPYDIPNVKADSLCVYTNNPVGGPYRGFGMSEIHWAIEQNIDAVAAKLNIDPAEFRRINAIRDGGKAVTGQVIECSGLVECIDSVVEKMDWDNRKVGYRDGKYYGKGIACMFKAPSMPNNVASSAVIKLNEDGTANLLISAMDIGQGSDTALTQIASEILTIPVEDICIVTGDTDTTPYEWQTVASRITYCCGNAVKKAAEDARDQLFKLASIGLGLPERDLELVDGQIRAKFYPDRKFTISELAMGLTLSDGSGYYGPIIGRGSFIPPNVMDTNKETGQGVKPTAFWTFGVQGAVVEIDAETGEIEIKTIVAAYDVGKAINPQLVEAQIEGGIIQGLGSALLEELRFENGRVINDNFVDYKIPTTSDIPEMIVSIIEKPEVTGPFGARGIGEPCMVPTAPAIANAIFSALGVRIRTLPLTSEKILKAIKESKAR